MPERVDSLPASLFDLTAPVISMLAGRDEAEAQGDTKAVAEYNQMIEEWTSGEIVAEKVDAICWAHLEYLRRAEVAEAEADRQKQRAAAWRKTAREIHESAFRAMVAHSVTKLESPNNTLTIKQNPPSLEVDELELPPEYKTFSVKGLGYDQWCRVLELLRSLTQGAPFADYLVQNCEATPLSKPVLKAMLKTKPIPGLVLNETNVRLEMK